MKKIEYTAEHWRAFCILLLIAILVMAYLWHQSDKWRLRWIRELEDQIEQQQMTIEELQGHIEFLEEEMSL